MSRNEKVNELKAILDCAFAAHEARKAELVEQGFKSKDRQKLLKPLREVMNAANQAYVAAANKEAIKVFNEINAECIEEQRVQKTSKIRLI